MDADERNAEVFARISRIYRLLTTFMNSKFAQQLEKVPRIKGNIVKTNVLKKNPNYRKVEELFSFLRQYDQIGYSIRVIEQSPAINETFQRDIYHNILFNYLILKGYLEDQEDRVVPTRPKQRQRTLKPKFIREIIEELTEDYDLPDVEIRKVLIEELTKEQLMHEEAEERRRLVEEQERKRKEEEERIRLEKEAEKERIRLEKEAEKERIRQEKEAEEKRLFHERMLREADERRRRDIFLKELKRFNKRKDARKEDRDNKLAKYLAEREDFADAAQIIEEIEQRKLEAQERRKKQRQEEKERLKLEAQMRREQLRIQQEQAEREERERIEREEREALEMQIALDMEYLREYDAELKLFMAKLPFNKQNREIYASQLRAADEQREFERQQRLAQKAGQAIN